MKKSIIVLALLFYCWATEAQVNLLPNPSFEQYHSIPTGYSELDSVYDWYNPLGSTSDYFNTQASSLSAVGIPINYFGYQYPYQGNGYIGFYTYVSLYAWHEYAQCKLNSPLVVGTTYVLRMYVNSADFNDPTAGFIGVVTNNIGAFFSTYKYTDFANYVSTKTPQINFTQVFSDTTHWQLATQSFVADSAYDYMTFGNFFTDGATIRAINGSCTTGICDTTGYYFVDSVSLFKPVTITPPPVDTTTNPPPTSGGTTSQPVFDLVFMNAFSPNGDGVNDFFHPLIKNESLLNNYDLIIYNRWGETIFETTDYHKGWDGKFKNKEQPIESYIYLCKYTTTPNSTAQYVKGSFVLIR